MTKPRCETCRYFESYGPDIQLFDWAEASILPRHERGICHRFPPQPNAQLFPVVGWEEWCGEWKRKSSATM